MVHIERYRGRYKVIPAGKKKRPFYQGLGVKNRASIQAQQPLPELWHENIRQERQYLKFALKQGGTEGVFAIPPGLLCISLDNQSCDLFIQYQMFKVMIKTFPKFYKSVVNNFSLHFLICVDHTRN